MEEAFDGIGFDSSGVFHDGLVEPSLQPVLPVVSKKLEPDKPVVFTGLNSRGDLNGKAGICKWIHENGKVMVSIEGNYQLCCNVENVKPWKLTWQMEPAFSPGQTIVSLCPKPPTMGSTEWQEHNDAALPVLMAQFTVSSTFNATSSRTLTIY